MRPRTLGNTKGFTLIELMIVVVIIGILAALAIPRFGAAGDRAKEKEADGILKQVHTMQMAYKAQTGATTTDLTSAGPLVHVGWEPPLAANLKHYAVPTVSGVCAGMTKKGGTGSHSERYVHIESGNIANTCALATP